MSRRWRNLCMMAALVPAAAFTQQAVGPRFQTSHRCIACHNGLTAPSGEDVSIGFDWRATMMANAARDPYWLAGVRREITDHPESRAAIEDECSICHMPMARYESKQSGHEGGIFSHLPFDPGKTLDRLAADGVSCSLCHQISKDKLGTRASFTGGFVLGSTAPQGDRLEYGPFAVEAGLTRIMRSSSRGFAPVEGPHIRESEVCATCHTLITQTLGPRGEVIGELPEQVPYQEWLHSEYRTRRSCQSCHMPEVREPVPVANVLGQPRAGVSRHTFLGGNFFMLGTLNRYRDELGVEALPQEQAAASVRTVEHLQSQTARLSLGPVEIRGGRLEVSVSIENLGGHKLPTAYPSRRVWLHLTVRDRDNRLVFESGAIDAAGAIRGNANDADPARFEPHYAEITSPDEVQIYESVMADRSGAVTTGLLTAVRYLKDNRLLPHGFDKKTAGADIAVIGVAALDEDFTSGGDRVGYSVDLGRAQGPFSVEAELRFQSVSHRWAANLRNYDAPEPRRFTRYYDSMSAISSVVLATARAAR